MTAQTHGDTGLSFEEYIKFERAFAGDERFELDDGRVVLMAGGTERHDIMTGELAFLLRTQLGTGPCRVFPHNRKLRTGQRTSFYPDLLVRCGPGAHELYETDARLVVEVLSPSNDPQDRIRRLYAFQTLASVEAIWFVDPRPRVVTVHERDAAHAWVERQQGSGVLRLGEDLAVDLDWLWPHVDALASD